MAMWQIWLSASIILFILEAMTPGGFFLASVGLAALGATASAFFTQNVNIQLLVFTLTGLLVFFTIRPIIIKSIKSPELASNSDRLIGKLGTVYETIPSNSHGYVVLDGDRWMARSQDGKTIPQGALVKVISVGGASLTVEPVHKQTQEG